MKRIENKVYLIYKFTNKTNNKSYVGFTCRGIELRKYEHVYLSTTDSKFKIHQAIRKYGIENFNIEILEENITSLPKVNSREIFYINHFDTYKNGYNMTIGGGYRCDYVLSDASREKMRQAKLGVKQSIETRKKRSDALRGVPKSEEHKLHSGNALKGLKKSKETCEKISKMLIGKLSGAKNPAAIKINICDNNGKLKFVCDGNFDAICRQNDLPSHALRRSYYNDGKPIYSYKFMKKEVLNRYGKNIGWSAIKL